jgi:hypothetical protein
MVSEVSPELCDFLVTKGRSGWPGHGVRRLEVEGGVEVVIEVDADAKEVQVSHLSLNQEREPLPLFGRMRRARKRRHLCLAKPSESRHRVQ